MVVVTAYHLFIFRIRRQTVSQAEARDFPGVSMVIAVKNGSKALLKHLDRLCKQDYPAFEMILVNDHSDPEERTILENGVKGNGRIRLIHSEKAPGKKQALSLGVQEAKHDLILCTDADCYPAGPRWMQQMAAKTNGKEMVLGYSPYLKATGFLNRIIRFETIMTGVQYLSWALVGKPYMGVGRNILYPRSLFLQEDPYNNQQHIPYGDDDLWVQKAAEKTSVKVCFEKEAHVYSTPATSWVAWLHQKHRHLSAGHHYQKTSWWQSSEYPIALIFHWGLFFPLIILAGNLWIGISFLIGLLLRWWTHLKWTKRLGDQDTNLWFPILEMVYALYFVIMGAFTLVVKRKRWN